MSIDEVTNYAPLKARISRQIEKLASIESNRAKNYYKS